MKIAAILISFLFLTSELIVPQSKDIYSTSQLFFKKITQINRPVKFPLQDISSSNTDSYILGLPNNDILFFWRTDNRILSAKSSDGGNTWSNESIVTSNLNTSEPLYLNALVTDSNKILVIYKNLFTYLVCSSDNGSSWTSITQPPYLPTGNSLSEFIDATNQSFSRYHNTIFLVYSKDMFFENKGLYYIKSSDNGFHWSQQFTISSEGLNGNIVPLTDSHLLIFFEDSSENNTNIFKRESTNSGNSWGPPIEVVNSELNERNPKCFMIQDTLWIFYQQDKPTSFQNINQPDIVSIKSTDDGITWSSPSSFTKYVGIDGWHNVSNWNNQPIISFSTSRDYQINNQNYQIYFGISGVSEDSVTPPYIHFFKHTPEIVHQGDSIIFNAYSDDDNHVSSVFLLRKVNTLYLDTVMMYDDGMHNDSLPGDNIYGFISDGILTGNFLQYYFILTDNENNMAGLNGGEIIVPLPFDINFYLFEVNRFKVPFNNTGVIANVNVNGIEGGWYDESKVLFSGGFYLSGKNGNNIWASACASASRIEDYVPGMVGSSVNDPKNQLYIVKASDPPFGESWQHYSYAVQIGADFYDGNNDGIYNPDDLNGNDTWDLNEDRPDILGDITAWCVYNDGKPSNQRTFNDQYPLGIEIKQTAFALGENLTGPIENMFFVRYLIENKGTVTTEIDPTYFSIWSDTDIGGEIGYTDDLVGCDTLLNSGYAYNDGDDNAYGINPPSIFLTLLQGPAVYIPGETFIDNNSNGIFEDSIDTPIDTAIINNGLFIGSTVLPGAKNLQMTSFMQYQRYFNGLSDPTSSIEAWYFTRGYNSYGEIVDPCTLPIGTVLGGVNCAQVNPFYLYSGDPVTNYGWINTGVSDQRIMVNTGPFKLKQNEPVEIWAAYVVGRGSNSLNSITKAREHVEYAHRYYNSNFTTLPVDADLENPVVNNFVLYQNYPNPFNPVTTIKYQIPETGKVTLKVYDILGQEIITLVNKEQVAGSYEINFNASSLSSGIYFYELRTENFSSVKKMILLR